MSGPQLASANCQRD